VLHAALQTQRWDHQGPAIVCSYKVAHDTAAEAAAAAVTAAATAPRSTRVETATTGADTLRRYNGIAPDVAYNAFRFLTGPAFRAFIAGITGSSLGGVAGQVRCFAHGDYTLVCDPAFKSAAKQTKAANVGVSLPPPSAAAGGAGAAARPSASVEGASILSTGDAVTGSDAAAAVAAATLIDATLACVAADEWPDEHGGFVSYLTTDDELLTVNPKQNTLSIVCR
jgi:hypothetical protein